MDTLGRVILSTVEWLSEVKNRQVHYWCVKRCALYGGYRVLYSLKYTPE